MRSMKTDKKDNTVSNRKRLLWTLLFFVIAALSVWAVSSQAKDFSPARFIKYVRESDHLWLTAAIIAMLLYIAFDALMIRSLITGMGHKRSFAKSISYASADIYFSAITPSGTGGQPVEVLLMMKDGVPGAVSTAAAMIYLFFYTLAIVIIGLVSMIFVPGSFIAFGTLGRVFIIIGAVIQTSLAFLYYMLLWKKNLLLRIAEFGLKVLSKLHIIKKTEQRRDQLENVLEQYHIATKLVRGKKGLLIKAILYNIAHRGSQLLVTVFCFLAGGGRLADAPRLFAMQAQVVLGACFIPTPGSMGAADYLMLDGFSSLMSEEQAVNLELLSRSASFYICVLLCGVIVLSRFAALRIRKNDQ